MTSFWSHRPHFLHLGLFFAAYVLGCGVAQPVAFVPGTGISFWPPGGILIATLVVAPVRNWPWFVLTGCLAELLCNFWWFHNPLSAAFLIYFGNALGAAAGAWLVSRTCTRPVRLETVQEVLAFVVFGAGLAPVISATIGSATLAGFSVQSQTFAAAWPLWWLGHATGVLILAPLALVVNWRGKLEFSAERWMEAGILGVIFFGVTTLSLSSHLAFAYIIMPPLLWAAVRFEFRGAAVALILLALITAIFTVSGASQFAGEPESRKHKEIMPQLFLVISAFSALIVAAISRQHQLGLLALRRNVEALRDREHELSQLVDMVPSHVWRLTPAGEPIFFNKRMVDFLGFDVTDIDQPGMTRLEAMINAAVHWNEAAALRDSLRHCLASGKSFAMRYRLRRADGAYRWMSSRAEPLRDRGGRIAQWYGLAHDIDDQTNAEEELRRSERRLRQLIDTVPALIWSMTPEGTMSYVNTRFKEITGATLEHVTARDGSASLSVIHPDDVGAARQALNHSFATGAPYVQTYRQLRADGGYRWTETRAEPLRDEFGAILHWYGVSVDIDDVVTAQEALRDRERELSHLVNMVPVHIRRLTKEGEPTFFNKRLIDFFGLDVADLIKPGTSRLAAAMTTLVHPDDASRLMATVRRSVATGDPYSMKYRMRRADGAYRWVDGRAEPLRDEGGAIVQWYAISIDVDDEMRAQEALRDRERELSHLVDMVPSYIWRLGPDGEPNFYNKRLIDYFGSDVANADQPGMSRLAAVMQAAVHPDDAAGLAEALSYSFTTGETFSMRCRLRRADGVYRWTEGRAEPLRDQEGRIVQWYGLSNDIEDRLLAEEALRESEQQFRQLIDTLPTLVWAATPEGEPSYMNKRLVDYVGLRPSDLDAPDTTRLQLALKNSVHQDDDAAVQRALAHSFGTGDAFAMKYRHRRADGSYRWVDGRAAPMRDLAGRIAQWYGIIIDIDDDVRTQEELRKTKERLAVSSQAASLAELSASIAHEVNQPLAAIVANSHACHRWLTAEPPNLDRAKITAERIIRDANSAADVVSRIRALFKQAVKPRDCTTLSSVIAEACDLMAEEAVRRRIRIDIQVECSLPLVAFDRIQIQQVLVNLMRNGMEAMDSTAGDRTLGVRMHRMGDVVQTEISDRGAGVEFPDRIFQSFFTTKEQGMGMGLAICRSIIDSHGGRLWAEKNDTQGATFIFTLPTETKAAL